MLLLQSRNVRRSYFGLIFLACMELSYGLSCTDISTGTKRTPNNVAIESSTSNNEQANNRNDNPSDGSASAGEYFFVNDVLPNLSLCKRCHAPQEIPIENEEKRGPTTIFKYEEALTLLDQSQLLQTLRNRNPERPHPNRDPCLAGLNSSPCREIAEWWDIEFGQNPDKINERPLSSFGEVRLITLDGVAEGWVVNPSDLSETISVELYIDNNLIGTAQADHDIFDNNTEGSHGFRVVLNDSFRNGARFQLKVRIRLDNNLIDLAGSPYVFAALPKKEGGDLYFEDNLRNILIANCGCHGNSLDYEYSWARLAQPLRTNNGSSVNNRFFLKASGRVQHSGGNSCDGNTVCDEISLWWQREFDD